MRPIRVAVAVGTVLGSVLGLTVAAHGLWSDETTLPGFTEGGVSFSAVPVGSQYASQLQYSTNGAAVTVTLPGSTVAKVLTDAQPVVWQFFAIGSVQGARGLTYDVTADEPAAGTLLSLSTLKIFRPGANGCAPPATPAGDEDQHVIVYGGEDHELIPAAAHPSGASGFETWCAALTSDAIDSVYASDAEVDGKADDGTTSSAKDTWRAQLTPDPADEPDVVITLDPAVTHP